MIKYEPVIGLEVHTQVKTASKMFCGCPADSFGREPNSNTCPVCLALPGALPVPNEVAIQKTVQLAQALGCRLAEFSQFERKNYFYPDLPKGFQISQYAHPVGEMGKFEGVTVRRVHLEEDTGKLIHEGGESLVDFNRSGVPLIEIVTEPEFSDPVVVTKFLKELRKHLVFLEISTADMEKGSLRLEANISLRRIGENGLPPYKVELKNINSFAFLEKALGVEIKRQQELLEKGEEIAQETRGYNEKQGVTVSQRRKEEAFDYRYFPEPDLPPLTKSVLVAGEKTGTPQEKRESYLALGVPSQYVEVLIQNRELSAIFEDLRVEIPAAELANILVNRRLGDPLELGKEKILSLYRQRRTKEVLSGGAMTDATEKVLLDNPAAVADYVQGKETALQFLLGQLMKESGGKIDPQEGRELLRKAIYARTSA
ncbi:MAG TPA: Asp-tRNA(Asn)/Glu-tRNA(Gln) amidotransferase subunit GatB [Patescibacteria group bacterium]|nr:Asp-tRNA(Asn)/Glu-tRNA(Gln) amidotransferase subunit GatB [Patescibacteria group bacterium]